CSPLLRPRPPLASPFPYTTLFRSLLALSPDLQIDRHQVRLDEDNTAALLRGYDLVLDGTDNFTTRYVVNDACTELGIPLVWASIDRKSTRLNSSHVSLSYAVFCSA